jgi:arylsulfatase
MIDLWTAEAERNNVFPISDGLIDRLSGFVPPAWPAGHDHTYWPGGGAVSDESIPPLWGGFRMTADIDAATGAEGVILALGDWFGGYALYAVGGIIHFSFARSSDVLELVAPTPVAVGQHEIGVFYGVGGDGKPGRMLLLLDGDQVDEIDVKGNLPVALQHGGAGLRLGRDTGFPVSPRYSPPAEFSGVVYSLRIETPGARRPDPAEEVRTALHAD